MQTSSLFKYVHVFAPMAAFAKPGMLFWLVRQAASWPSLVFTQANFVIVEPPAKPAPRLSFVHFAKAAGEAVGLAEVGVGVGVGDGDELEAQAANTASPRTPDPTPITVLLSTFETIFMSDPHKCCLLLSCHAQHPRSRCLMHNGVIKSLLSPRLLTLAEVLELDECGLRQFVDDRNRDQ